jgi:phosphoglycerate dehydrogenase-like enzyme
MTANVAPSRKPRLLALASTALFRSFFDRPREKELTALFDWTRSASKNPRALRGALAHADALLTTWDSPRFGEELLEQAPHLRMIAHCGGEVGGRFAKPLFRALTITNASAPMAPYVAEMAVALLLYTARNIDAYRKAGAPLYRRLHREGAPDETLRGRDVGLLGFGQIGQAIAARLHPFGARLHVFDPYVPATLIRKHGGRPARWVELLRCPSLVLAAGLTQETRGLLDRRALAQLPDGAVVINVARGGIVDLRALTREVVSGRLRCALDVTDPEEPLPSRHPLRRAPGAILTPHIAAASVQVRRDMADVVLSELDRFAHGRRPRHRVTLPMLARMT